MNILYSLICFLTALILGGCQEAKSKPVYPSEPNQPTTEVPDPNQGTEQGGEESGDTPTTPKPRPKATYIVSSVTELKELNLKPGDIVDWADGVYDNVQIKLSNIATETSPIILRAQTPGRVVFRGQSNIVLSGQWLEAQGFSWIDLDTGWKKAIMQCDRGSAHCSFRDCKIDGNKSKISETDSKWVSLYGQYNTIEYCHFDNKRNMGCLLVVWMEDGIIPYHTIKNNYFTRPYTHYDDKGKARNSQESIRIGDSAHSMQDACCLVEGNHFYKCDGERAEIISNKTCRNTYRANLFEESVGTLTLRHGNYCLIEGNYFLANKKADVGGVRIIGEGHTVKDNFMIGTTGEGYMSAICLVRGEPNAELSGYWRVKDSQITGNTLLNCRYGIVVNYTGRETQQDCPLNTTFKSNLIISANNSGYTPVTVIDTPAEQMRWLLNTIYKGKCKGIDLEITEIEPQTPEYEAAINRIKTNSGISWE